LYQPYFERLIAWSSTPERKDELLRAKAEYFALAGEVFEDDRSFDTRMGAFLEYFVFDRKLEGTDTTPAEAFLARQGESLSPAEREVFGDLTRTIHGLFEVRKLVTKTGVRLRDLVTGEEHEIFERRGLVGLNKGDLLEARLVPHGGKLLFGESSLYHPREVRKAIIKELKRRRKAGELPTSSAFAHELAKMALKLERYRNVAVENIYRFDT
jgi:hypothetical protein